MGVATRVVVYAPDEERATAGAAAAYERIGQLDAMMSDYRIDSDLNRLSDRAGGGAMHVPAELFEVLREAKELSRASDGAFDVTAGPAVALWRRARKSGALPTEGERIEALGLVDWTAMELDEGAGTARLARAGMRLDLGGIAKGYAAERAVRVLRERGLPRAMVGMAGDIVAGEAPPGAEGWRVAVVGERSTEREEGAGRMVLVLRNCAVSTSGDSEQSIEIGGRRYSHIVDPRTGLGMTAVRSVTVVAPTGDQSDPLATTACVLGEVRARVLLGTRPGVAAIFEEGGKREVFDPDGVLRFAERAGE